MIAHSLGNALSLTIILSRGMNPRAWTAPALPSLPDPGIMMREMCSGEEKKVRPHRLEEERCEANIATTRSGDHL